MADTSLPLGKLPPHLLAAFLADLPQGQDVVVGARPGEDAAVVRLGERYLVLALDPVTLSPQPGRFAVQINANDIAVMGAELRWLLAALLLPAGTTASRAESIMAELRAGCAQLGVDLVGGHTEITSAVTQPVVAACMLGEVDPRRLVTSSGAGDGDSLLLAGPIAVEGTAILAQDEAATLRARGVPEETIRQAAALLEKPGISVLPAVRALLAAALPHAMHDPTEGGLLSAARELAEASGLGLRLEADRVPILPACRAICGALDLDPLRLLASGSLLAAVATDDVEPALTALSRAGIEAAAIGRFLAAEEGMTLRRNGVEEPLPAAERDELARWIESKT